MNIDKLFYRPLIFFLVTMALNESCVALSMSSGEKTYPVDAPAIAEFSKMKIRSSDIIKDASKFPSEQNKELATRYRDSRVRVNSLIDALIFCVELDQSCKEVESKHAEVKVSIEKLNEYYRYLIDNPSQYSLMSYIPVVADFVVITLPAILSFIENFKKDQKDKRDKLVKQLEGFKWKEAPSAF